MRCHMSTKLFIFFVRNHQRVFEIVFEIGGGGEIRAGWAQILH